MIGVGDLDLVADPVPEFVNSLEIEIERSGELRLASQVGMLMVFPFWIEGALAGAASLVGCMTVEALYLYRVARPMYDALPDDGREQPTNRQMWSFSWPLMVTTGDTTCFHVVDSWNV